MEMKMLRRNWWLFGRVDWWPGYMGCNQTEKVNRSSYIAKFIGVIFTHKKVFFNGETKLGRGYEEIVRGR